MRQGNYAGRRRQDTGIILTRPKPRPKPSEASLSAQYLSREPPRVPKWWGGSTQRFMPPDRERPVEMRATAAPVRSLTVCADKALMHPDLKRMYCVGPDLESRPASQVLPPPERRKPDQWSPGRASAPQMVATDGEKGFGGLEAAALQRLQRLRRTAAWDTYLSAAVDLQAQLERACYHRRLAVYAAEVFTEVGQAHVDAMNLPMACKTLGVAVEISNGLVESLFQLSEEQQSHLARAHTLFAQTLLLRAGDQLTREEQRQVDEQLKLAAGFFTRRRAEDFYETDLVRAVRMLQLGKPQMAIEDLRSLVSVLKQSADSPFAVAGGLARAYYQLARCHRVNTDAGGLARIMAKFGDGFRFRAMGEDAFAAMSEYRLRRLPLDRLLYVQILLANMTARTEVDDLAVCVECGLRALQVSSATCGPQSRPTVECHMAFGRLFVKRGWMQHASSHVSIALRKIQKCRNRDDVASWFDGYIEEARTLLSETRQEAKVIEERKRLQIAYCCNLTCDAREGSPSTFHRCTRCDMACFCSEACAEEAWADGHRDLCDLYPSVARPGKSERELGGPYGGGEDDALAEPEEDKRPREEPKRKGGGSPRRRGR